MDIRAGVACVVLSLAAATAPALSATQGEGRPPPSGFLSDYSKLKAATDREGVMLYVSPSAKGEAFSKVMLQPVEVYVSPNAQYKGVQPDVLKRMADELQSALKKS